MLRSASNDLGGALAYRYACVCVAWMHDWVYVCINTCIYVCFCLHALIFHLCALIHAFIIHVCAVIHTLTFHVCALILVLDTQSLGRAEHVRKKHIPEASCAHHHPRAHGRVRAGSVCLHSFHRQSFHTHRHRRRSAGRCAQRYACVVNHAFTYFGICMLCACAIGLLVGAGVRTDIERAMVCVYTRECTNVLICTKHMIQSVVASIIRHECIMQTCVQSTQSHANVCFSVC